MNNTELLEKMKKLNSVIEDYLDSLAMDDAAETQNTKKKSSKTSEKKEA